MAMFPGCAIPFWSSRENTLRGRRRTPLLRQHHVPNERMTQKRALSPVHRSWSHKARMPAGTTRSRVALIAFCWNVGRYDGAAAISEFSVEWDEHDAGLI